MNDIERNVIASHERTNRQEKKIVVETTETHTWRTTITMSGLHDCVDCTKRQTDTRKHRSAWPTAVARLCDGLCSLAKQHVSKDD